MGERQPTGGGETSLINSVKQIFRLTAVSGWLGKLFLQKQREKNQLTA
jgi:hypothetical protein